MINWAHINFYEDNVIIEDNIIIVTSSVTAVFCPFFYDLPRVKHHCELRKYEYQTNECIQQRNLFKCQTSTFYFSTYRPNLFEHLLTHADQTI